MSLSPQQIRAAELLAEGRSQQEVGDRVGVSRRTILRWLKQPDFKNLSFGLIGRTQSPKPAPQPEPQRQRQTASLRVEDLIPDALEVLRVILQDPEARIADRLKAVSLIGSWAGLEARGKMHEMEAVKLLIEAGWLSGTVLDVIVNGADKFAAQVREALLGIADQGEKNIYEEFLEKIKKDPSPENSGEGSLATHDGSQVDRAE